MKNYKTLVIALFSLIFLTLAEPSKAAGPLIVSCSPDFSTIQSGESVTWSATVSGGDGNYTFDWSDEDGNTSSLEDFSQTYETTDDNYTISKYTELTVTDGLGESASTDCEVTVIGELTFLGCEANEVAGETGVPIRWSAEVVGGLEPYDFVWTGDDELSGDSDLVSMNYETAGTKTASITTISSSDGQTLVGPFDCGSVDIFETPGELTASCSANPDSVRRNVLVDWSATVSGGSEPYTITWSGDDGLFGDGESVSKSYSTVGDKTASIIVTSSDGQMVVGVDCLVEVKGNSGGGSSEEEIATTTIPLVLGTSTESIPENPPEISDDIVITTAENYDTDGNSDDENSVDDNADEQNEDNQNGEDSDDSLNEEKNSDQYENSKFINSLQASAAIAFIGDNAIWFGIGALVFVGLIIFGFFLRRKNQNNQ